MASSPALARTAWDQCPLASPLFEQCVSSTRRQVTQQHQPRASSALPSRLVLHASKLPSFTPKLTPPPFTTSFLPPSTLPSTRRSRKQAPGFALRRSGQATSTTCSIGDFVGGDLLNFDLGQWVDDVEKFGAVGFYAPPEGGAECRYATALKYQGYHFMNVSARGLGDIEAYLLKAHGIRPPHLGKQAVARFYTPGEVDLRLSVLPSRYKGIVVWVYEAKVLSKNELQFLTVLPALRPQVKVVCELGGARKFNWKPLKDIVGLPAPVRRAAVAASEPAPAPAPAAEKLPQGKAEVEEVLVAS